MYHREIRDILLVQAILDAHHTNVSSYIRVTVIIGTNVTVDNLSSVFSLLHCNVLRRFLSQAIRIFSALNSENEIEREPVERVPRLNLRTYVKRLVQ
jgi:hypothetical protein